MERFEIEGTEVSPSVVLDPFTDSFRISGESRPENARKFFQPVLDWVDSYNQVLFFLKTEKGQDYQKDLVFEFSFDYLNSTSLKFVYDMLKKIEALKPNCTSLKVRWLYEPGDEDMKENGEELAKLIQVPFEIKQESPA